MELKDISHKLGACLHKYRYMLIVVIIGIALLLLPTSGTTTQKEKAIPTKDTPVVQDMSKRLEEILSQIDGAGEVRVLLSVAAGEETIFQVDTDQSQNAESDQIKQDTVVITDGERAQKGLIRQMIPPTYSGAVVICKGAESPTVRLSVVSAVSKLTGLGADRISVLKMK